MNLSILDFGSVNNKHEDISDVYNALFENVEICDQLGFKKYWLSEHYANNYSWNKPDMILPLLLSTTEKINIGVAGILFKFREAYRTACDYNVLTALFPGRVDLGLASGAPVKEILAEIDMIKSYDDIENWYTNLLGYYEKKEILVIPNLKIKPNIWVLGSGGKSFNMAKKYNCDYCFSITHLLSSGVSEKNLLDNLVKAKEQHTKTSVLISGCIAETRKIAMSNYESFIDISGPISHANKGFYNVLGTIDDFYKKTEYIKNITGVDNFVFKDLNLSKNKGKSIKLLGELI